MKAVGISILTLVVIVVYYNVNYKQRNISNNSFNAWQTISHKNFLLRWENATLKAIDTLTPILIQNSNYSKKTVNEIKEKVINSKAERIFRGKKIYGSRNWILNKFSEYKNIYDTITCDAMYLIELNEEGEVMTSTDWLVLFLDDNCRLVLSIDNSGFVRAQKKSVNRNELEKLIKDNYPSAIKTKKCLEKGEGLPMADIYISKFAENTTEVFPFPVLCSGFFEKFLSLMQK